MGLKKIYLDSCIAIYVVEAHPLYATKVAAELNALQAAQICYSPLVRLECVVKPLQSQNQSLQKLYAQFWASQQNLSLVDDIFMRAAQLRADFPSVKTPDCRALQQLALPRKKKASTTRSAMNRPARSSGS